MGQSQGGYEREHAGHRRRGVPGGRAEPSVFRAAEKERLGVKIPEAEKRDTEESLRLEPLRSPSESHLLNQEN